MKGFKAFDQDLKCKGHQYEVASGDNVIKGDGKCVTDEITILRELSRGEVLAARNTGKDCTGIGNTGNRNTGYRNTGDYNTGNYSSGVLCTEEPECLIFDQPSGMTLREWRGTEAAMLMSRIELKTTEWRCEDDMSDQEKADHPEHELAGGYLKKHANTRYNFAEWWERLTAVEKNIIKAIPNFDAAKWEKITGVRL